MFVMGLLLVSPVAAQVFPAKPVKLILGFAPSSTPDVVTRTVAAKMGEDLGQMVIVENRPGAAGTIATEAVARAPADGYTLLVVAGNIWTIPLLRSNVRYDVIRDFAPITWAARSPNALVVHPSVPANTLAEFVDYVRKNPGRVNFASQGNGSSGHLMGELFKMHAKVEITHVPYKGGAQALTDLMAGNVQMMFDNVGAVLPHIKAGKLKGLAVSTTAPSPQAPELPPIASVIPGFDATIWFGFVGPAGIPQATRSKLNEHFVKALRSPEIVKAFEDRGVTIVGSPADVLGKRIETDLERWGKVVKEANISIQ